jgi:hypothetical protein
VLKTEINVNWLGVFQQLNLVNSIVVQPS